MCIPNKNKSPCEVRKLIRGYRGIISLTVFLVVDGLLIWWVNSSPRTVTAAPLISSGDQGIITLVLAGAAVIAVLAAIMFKSKPVPARFR